MTRYRQHKAWVTSVKTFWVLTVDAGGGESLAGEMGGDEISVLLSFDKDECLVLGVAGLEDFL